MNITVTARKTMVKDSFREKIEKKLAKLDKFFQDDPTAEASVLVSNENGRERVEITVRSKGMLYRGERVSEDRAISLNGAVDLLIQQIVKNKKKLEKRVKEVNFGAFDDYAAPASESEEFEVVRNKRFVLKPMDINEAILQMNMIGHQFFIFHNSESDTVSVVYRRNDGGYGLIEVEE